MTSKPIKKGAVRVPGRQPKFQERTWLSTSDKICQAQCFPPGFRIVLLDRSGALVKRPPRVTSGDFGAFPISWPVKLLLLEGVATCVRDDLSRWSMELRNHEGEPINEGVTLRRVREMPGSDHNPAFDSQSDLLCDLESELEDALGVFDPEFDHRISPDPEVFLKALMSFILSRYDVDALETVLEFFELDISQKREAETHQWDHLILK